MRRVSQGGASARANSEGGLRAIGSYWASDDADDGLIRQDGDTVGRTRMLSYGDSLGRQVFEGLSPVWGRVCWVPSHPCVRC